jgi:hypothetical protein
MPNTPQDVQNQINNTPWTANRGLVTGASMASDNQWKAYWNEE